MTDANITFGGKLPFFLTVAIVFIAIGGISWTHGSSFGMWVFYLGFILFCGISLVWIKQSIEHLKHMPKIARSGVMLALLAIGMFLFSGVLERGYDVATKKYGVNGKIDEFIGDKGVSNNAKATNIDLLVSFSKMSKVPIVIKKEHIIKYPLKVNYGSDFDIVIWLKNPYAKQITMRALLSVLPSTSATLIKARDRRYPVIELPAKSEKKLVLKLHLAEKLPEHIHDLTVGVSFFKFDNKARN